MYSCTLILVMLSVALFRSASAFNRFAGPKFLAKSSSLAATVTSGPVKLKGAADLIARTDVFIFDCDGVIWYVILTNTVFLEFMRIKNFITKYNAFYYIGKAIR